MANSLVTYGRDNEGNLVAIAPLAKSGAVLCLDTSYSMAADDAGDGLRRIDVLAHVLAEILASVELVACCSFGWTVSAVPLSGEINIPEPAGSTPMAESIAWALDHGAKHIFLVTDGSPDSQDACMKQATICRERGVRISARYCGPRDGNSCEAWLNMLCAAAAPGGTAGSMLLTMDNVADAAESIVLQLTHG